MAKVIIEIEDRPGDKVAVKTTPTFETLMAMDISGSKLTAAHGYAFAIINKVREISKQNEPLITKIPLIK